MSLQVTNKVYLPADPETWVKEAKKPSRAPREGVRKRSAAPKQRAVKPNKRRRKRDGDVVMAETDESESEVESIEEVEDDVPAKAEVQKVCSVNRIRLKRIMSSDCSPFRHLVKSVLQLVASSRDKRKASRT